MLPRRFETKVVGVSFVKGYPDNLNRMATAINQGRVYTEPDSEFREVQEQLDKSFAPVLLVRKPHPKDANAIEVHFPGEGRIGYVPRATAARLAPELDAGAKFLAGMVGVWINPNHRDRPGCSIRIERQEPGHG